MLVEVKLTLQHFFIDSILNSPSNDHVLSALCYGHNAKQNKKSPVFFSFRRISIMKCRRRFLNRLHVFILVSSGAQAISLFQKLAPFYFAAL